MTGFDDDFWSDRFHFCALVAGAIAHREGRLSDSDYVRQLAYELFEGGEFRDGNNHSTSKGQVNAE